MSTLEAETMPDGAVGPARARRRGRLSIGLGLGLAGVALFIAVGVISRFWLPGGVGSIMAVDIAAKLLPPLSPGHPLGTDFLGRDMLAQIMRATSNTLVIVVLGTAMAACLGLAVGLFAAMLRGLTEQILMRFVDVVYAIPAILLALVLAAKLGASVGTTVAALGLWFFPLIARVTRSAALTVRERAFIKAARSYGRGNLFIAWRHVLPNIISIILVQVTLVMALGILVEASLAFLGVGTQPPEPSWGRMLKESQQYFSLAPWLAIVPGITIILAVLAFNLLGNGLRDRLDRRAQAWAAE
jgi:peptide/nickel transport system permease protein